MTDELLLRRLRIGWHDDDTPIWVSDAMTEAAARIEQLTAERDKYASSWMTAEDKLADAEALIEAQAKDHASNNIRFAEAEPRAKTAEAERDRLRSALIEERTETLWNAYGAGMERDGRWRHMCMSDGEWLEFECGLDNSQPDHPADVVKAAIPLAAKRFVAALAALKGETP